MLDLDFVPLLRALLKDDDEMDVFNVRLLVLLLSIYPQMIRVVLSSICCDNIIIYGGLW